MIVMGKRVKEIAAIEFTGRGDKQLKLAGTSNLTNPIMNQYTLSGYTGNVVASHASAARLILADVGLIYTMHEALRGHWCTAHDGGSCNNQSIGSTVSDNIVHSWLFLTANKSSPLGCFSTVLQVINN